MTHQLLVDNPDLQTAIDLYDSWVELTMHRKHQPGLAVGIVYDGELLWGKGFGYADIEAGTPVTLDTRFRIASISKTFTAVGILQLRDAGRLSLDDPASKYLDWFDLRYDGAPPITIRSLLTHASGLPRDSHNPMWTDCDAPGWDEFASELQKRAPTRAPNDKFAYSNVGYSLLGGIIEAVSGQTWGDYLQQNVLDHLCMSETYPVPRADDPLLAKGYAELGDDYQREVKPFFLMNGFEASANFASSIKDLVKYAAFHMSADDNPVLSSHSLRDMHRVHWLYEDWQGGYGLGTMLYKIKDWQISGHGGGYPGYLTYFSVCRDQNVGLILLTNALASEPMDYVNQGYKTILPELIKATEESKPEADPAWQQYLGLYKHSWGIEQVVIRNGQLQIVALDWMDEPPVILEPTDDEHVFTMQAPGQSNETARFELDGEGEVFKLWIRNEYVLKTK